MTIEPLTKESWRDYLAADGHSDHCLVGHIQATQGFVKEIDAILDRSKSFKELKLELTKFSVERKLFLENVINSDWELETPTPT